MVIKYISEKNLKNDILVKSYKLNNFDGWLNRGHFFEIYLFFPYKEWGGIKNEYIRVKGRLIGEETVKSFGDFRVLVDMGLKNDILVYKYYIKDSWRETLFSFNTFKNIGTLQIKKENEREADKYSDVENLKGSLSALDFLFYLKNYNRKMGINLFHRDRLALHNFRFQMYQKQYKAFQLEVYSCRWGNILKFRRNVLKYIRRREDEFIHHSGYMENLSGHNESVIFENLVLLNAHTSRVMRFNLIKLNFLFNVLYYNKTSVLYKFNLYKYNDILFRFFHRVWFGSIVNKCKERIRNERRNNKFEVFLLFNRRKIKVNYMLKFFHKNKISLYLFNLKNLLVKGNIQFFVKFNNMLNFYDEYYCPLVPSITGRQYYQSSPMNRINRKKGVSMAFRLVTYTGAIRLFRHALKRFTGMSCKPARNNLLNGLSVKMDNRKLLQNVLPYFEAKKIYKEFRTVRRNEIAIRLPDVPFLGMYQKFKINKKVNKGICNTLFLKNEENINYTLKLKYLLGMMSNDKSLRIRIGLNPYNEKEHENLKFKLFVFLVFNFFVLRAKKQDTFRELNGKVDMNHQLEYYRFLNSFFYCLSLGYKSIRDIISVNNIDAFKEGSLSSILKSNYYKQYKKLRSRRKDEELSLYDQEFLLKRKRTMVGKPYSKKLGFVNNLKPNFFEYGDTIFVINIKRKPVEFYMKKIRPYKIVGRMKKYYKKGEVPPIRRNKQPFVKKNKVSFYYKRGKKIWITKKNKKNYNNKNYNNKNYNNKNYNNKNYNNNLTKKNKKNLNNNKNGNLFYFSNFNYNNNNKRNKKINKKMPLKSKALRMAIENYNRFNIKKKFSYFFNIKRYYNFRKFWKLKDIVRRKLKLNKKMRRFPDEKRCDGDASR